MQCDVNKKFKANVKETKKENNIASLRRWKEKHIKWMENKMNRNAMAICALLTLLHDMCTQVSMKFFFTIHSSEFYFSEGYTEVEKKYFPPTNISKSPLV